jgi:O-antigen ligase
VWRYPVFAWIIATLIAIIVAPDHIAALGLWRAYILEPLAYFILLAGCLRTEQDRQRVIQALIGVTSFIFLWSVFQFVTGHGIPHPWDTAIATRRTTGPFPFPNAVSLFCTPIAALCTGLLTLEKNTVRAQRSLLIAGIVSGLGATLLAKSAGGTIAILVAASVALIANAKMRKWAIGSIILALIIAFGVPQIRIPLVRLLSFQDWSGNVRLIIWRETRHMLTDRPIFGAGLGAYPEVIAPYHTATAIEIFQYPHNILLNLWSETGLLGIIAFTWICIVWFRRSRHSSIVYYLPLLAILIQGLVDVPYFKNDLAMLFWVFAALV